LMNVSSLAGPAKLQTGWAAQCVGKISFATSGTHHEVQLIQKSEDAKG